MLRRWLCLALVSCATTLFSQANNAGTNKDRDAAVISRMETHVHFEDDGTGYRESSVAVKVTSEAGVEAYGQLAFGYSSETEKLEISYVRVRKPNGQVVDTPSSATNDFAPLAMQSAPMYDDYRERHVSVVSLRPGDVLEYKITTHVTSALAPGQFWYEFSFPDAQRVQQATLIIDVPNDRQVQLKSPQRKFTSSEAGRFRTYTWTVSNLVPVEHKPDEFKSDEDQLPDIQLSSFTDWKQVAQWYATLQGKQVLVDDSIRKKAAELTAGASTAEEKAERLYSFVSLEFRYVSLSFGVGRYLPHPSNEVLRTSYGDCKDKHTLFSALLKAAGISSYPVLIGAGRHLDPDVPSPSQFNHVFTVIELPGKRIWADTTAEVAPFGLVSYSLRGEKGLIASNDANAGLIQIPLAASVKNSMVYNLTGKVSETGALDATVELTTTGDSALLFRTAFRSTSQSDWKRLVQLLLPPDEKDTVTDVAVEALEKPAQPLKLTYHWHRDSFFTAPSAQTSFFPFLPMRYGPLPKTTRPGEPLRVGPAGEIVHRLHLELPSNFVAHVPSDITVRREFGSYEAHFKAANHALDAERRLVISVDSVPLLRRADIETLRTVASSSADQTISFSISTAVSEPRIVAAAESGATTDQLQRKAIEALKNQEFKTASDLLTRVVSQQPASADAWDELGRAYRGLGNDTEAVNAFRKQLEVAPKHSRAYVDLGSTLLELGQPDEAVAIYRKHLEMEPLDTTAHKQLGLALFRLKRDKEAIAELESATAPPAGDPEVQLALAELYARNNEAEQAKTLFSHILGVSLPAPGNNSFALALSDGADGAQVSNDARSVLSDLGDQFDSGTYAKDPAAAVDAMPLLALEWARVGWGEALNGHLLEAARFLGSAFALDPSPVLALRCAAVHMKAGHNAEAKHMLALAAAFEGAEATEAAKQLTQLDSAGANGAIAAARAELSSMREFRFSNKNRDEGKAEVALAFDGSSSPQSVLYLRGSLNRSAFESPLKARSYSFTFPDNSSIKIVRKAQVNCSGTTCTVDFEPIGNVLP